ncbi:uncharacterized protein LOC128219545 [Mya arenaria]|uniref:uncharacterized protein LOC128219545 n=1 Tax=Mya arenaria TaxID=6604 RepID=UPI0022E7EF96|nr:uncharacterized protein LOC128219545 [Mya arenaria]
MMNRAAFEAVLFLSFLAFTGCWACQTDSDCNDIHSPVCNTEHNYCEQRTCTNETDCGPLYYCIIYSDDPITGLPTGYCYLKSCMNDTECGDGVSMSCRYGTCNCRQGFRFDGTDCVSSLGLDCNYDYECSSFYDTATYVWGTKYVCLEGVCSCNEAMWAPDLDECVPYYGLPCAVDAECGHKSNTTCNLATGFCDCQAGYTARDGICVWALEATCTQPNDCPTPFECRNDTCSCPEGMAIKSLNDPTCAQVLDSSCRDIHMCADPDDHEYIKSYFFGMYQSDSSLWFAKRAYYCNVENMCKCAPGYMRSPSGLGCQPIYASECTTSSNCVGDSDVLSKAYDCVGGKCSCNAQHQFISVHDKYMHYGTARTSYDSPLEYICQPMIGMSCMYESYAHPDADCREYIGYNNYGSGYTYLTCYRGVEEHGNCSNILGSDCTEYRDVCNLVDNAKCSIDATCECKEGFYTPDWETDMCYGVLQTYYCENDSNCTDILPNTECVAGMCSCLNGYTEMNNVCIDDAELDAPCNAAVPDMPDIYRRSPSYRLSPREDPVKDDQLIGGWYNIGPYLPTRGTEAPDKGSCGTIHPVYLTDSISATELEDLNAGQEIAKAVTVGGLGDYGQVSAEEIRLRKCDNDYHAFLPSTPIAFSAYCIDTFRHSHAEGNSSELSVGVKQDLSFRTVFDAELGYDFYEPYLTFKCKVSWKKDSNDQSECPGCYLNSNLNDGLFYTIIWYVNGRFVKLQGPFLRSQLSQANITEEAIVNTTGESPSGYKVQCSVEWSETLVGKRSTPTFSSATL